MPKAQFMLYFAFLGVLPESARTRADRVFSLFRTSQQNGAGDEILRIMTSAVAILESILHQKPRKQFLCIATYFLVPHDKIVLRHPGSVSNTTSSFAAATQYQSIL
jgi:hypothetical protein